MFSQMIFEGMDSATFSPESADGLMLCASQDGPMTDQCGREAARASRSLQLEGEKEQQTNATSGPNSSDLSESAALQSFLASRLPAKMGSRGSTLFALTWKERVTPSGRRICALRASVRRISDNGSTGWASPTASNTTGAGTQGRQGGMNLQTQAMMAAWPTPTTRDWKDGKQANIPTNSLLGREVWKISGGGRDGLPAGMENQGRLNPSHARWLMGFPILWDLCAPKPKKQSRRK